MANTTVEVMGLPIGLTGLVLRIFDVGGDTLLNFGGADALTERTNAKGSYTATVTESIAGYKRAFVTNSDNTQLYFVGVLPNIADDTGTYTVVEPGAPAINSSGHVDAVTTLTEDISVTVGDDIAENVWQYATRTMTDGSIRVATPHQVGRKTIVRGASYYNADNNALAFTEGAEFDWPTDLFSASVPAWVVTLYAEPTAETLAITSGAANLGSTGVVGTVTTATALYVELSKANTQALSLGRGNGAYRYTLMATRATTPAKAELLESGFFDMVDDIVTP
jgi:hypothetical protein